MVTIVFDGFGREGCVVAMNTIDFDFYIRIDDLQSKNNIYYIWYFYPKYGKMKIYGNYENYNVIL